MKNRILLFLLTFTVATTTYAQQDSISAKKSWSLQECVDYALTNSLTVKRSQYSVENSAIDYQQAKLSILPSLNGSASHGYNWGRSIDPRSNAFVTDETSFNNLGAQSSVTLFNGLRIQNTIKQTRTDLDASESDLQKVKNDLIINIASLYLNVIFNKELYETARLQLNSSQQQLERTKVQVAAGALPRSDELNQEAQVATNELNLINRENALNLSLLQLKQAMQLPASAELDVIIPELSVEELVIDQSRDEIFEIAVKSMPEIESARLRVQSSFFSVKAAKGNLYPRLSLSGSIGTNYSSVADRPRFIPDGGDPSIVQEQIGYVQGTGAPVLQDVVVPSGTIENGYRRFDQFKDGVSRSASLNLSIPLFNGLQSRAAIQRAVIGREQAEIDARDTHNQLRQTIETAYNDAIAAAKTYNSALKQVSAREEAFRMVQQRRDVGAANFVEYQVAENDLFQARSDLVRAKYDFIFRKKVLDFYQGKTIEL